jgi:hypothetical protein
MCTYTCTYIHTNNIYAYMCMYGRRESHSGSHVLECVRTCTHAYIHTYIHIRGCRRWLCANGRNISFIGSHVPEKGVRERVYMHKETKTYIRIRGCRSMNLYVYTFICTRKGRHTHTCTHTCSHIDIHTYIHTGVGKWPANITRISIRSLRSCF